VSSSESEEYAPSDSGRTAVVVVISLSLESTVTIVVETGLAGFVEVALGFFAVSVSAMVRVFHPFGEGKPRVVMGRGQPGVWWVFSGF